MTASHLVAKLGDRHAMCGAKNPLPVVWIFWAGAHVVGHDMDVCPLCMAVAQGDLVPAAVRT